jgi:diaminohydroxyphosphoribosylaminopyrimidine deaminase/5-amino-6-(5-phosphoribosylamino)uracil reductase
MRIVLDENLRLSTASQLVRTATESPLVVFAGEQPEESKLEALRERGVDVITFGTRDLLSILKELARRSVQSILIEGGATLAGSFVDAGLINKATFFVAPLILGGREAPGPIAGSGAEVVRHALKLRDVTTTHRGEDLEITGYPETFREQE